MELVRRSLSCIIRARICRHPSQLIAARTYTNYHLPKQVSSPASKFIVQIRSVSAVPKPLEKTDLPNADGPNYTVAYAARVLERFEERCQRIERVVEKDFVKTFNNLTRIIEELEKKGKFNDEAKVDLSMMMAVLLRCCGKLMSDNPPKIRELLAGNVWEFTKQKNLPYDISHYNSLIRVLNENQTNFDPQKILDEMVSANISPDRVTYQRLINQYCLQGDINGATTLLEKMKDLGMELNELVFSALILGYGKQESPPSFNEMFDLMRSNGVEPGSPSFTAAILVQADKMSKDSTATDELKALFELIQQEEISFSIFETTDILTHLAPFKRDETVTKIFDYLSKIMLGSINARQRICNTLLQIGEYEEVSRFYWHYKPSDRGISSGSLGQFYIRLLATHEGVPVEHTIKECHRIKQEHNNAAAFHVLYYRAAEAGNMKLVRAALKEIGQEEQIKCQYFWPLIAQAKSEDEVIQVLKNDLSPKMDTEHLFETFCHWVWPKFSGKISRLFDANKELNYDYNLLVASLLHYSAAENKIEDAIEFIKSASESPTEGSTGEERLSRRVNLGDSVGRLLMQIAEQTKDPAVVKKTFNLCKIPGQHISTRTLNPLVKVHLLNDDFEAALKEFLELAENHRLTPCKQDLMIQCLEKKYPDQLQKIMNISNELYGENNALFDLAVCCLQCGKLKQAQRILTNPGFRVQPVRVYRNFRSLEGKSNITVLENYVHLVRDMYDVDQELLYQMLIDAYERTSNPKRALDLWIRMQEEEFQPSKRCLLMIAKLLERNKIDVPFQKPRFH